MLAHEPIEITLSQGGANNLDCWELCESGVEEVDIVVNGKLMHSWRDGVNMDISLNKDVQAKTIESIRFADMVELVGLVLLYLVTLSHFADLFADAHASRGLRRLFRLLTLILLAVSSSLWLGAGSAPRAHIAAIDAPPVSCCSTTSQAPMPSTGPPRANCG